MMHDRTIFNGAFYGVFPAPEGPCRKPRKNPPSGGVFTAGFAAGSRPRGGLTASFTASFTASAPASPCVGACGLDDAGLCRGCGRTAGEIAAWPGLDDAGKRDVLDRIAGRGAGAAGGAR